MHNYCNEELSELSPIYDVLSEIPLLDLCCGPFEETVSFDVKHIVKRCWCALINGKVSFDNVVINSNDLISLLSLSESNSLHVDNMVKPGDKQNVPTATKFMMNFITSVQNEEETARLFLYTFITSVRSVDGNGAFPYRLQAIKSDLIILSYVFEALLIFYVCPEVSISCQIKSLSIGAHSVFYIHRCHGSSALSNHLVHDIQATFQNAIFCCAKAQVYFPEKPLYLVRDGTDPLEGCFGVVRAKNKNCNMDSLEFIHCISAMSEVDNMIMNKHPEWAKSSTLSKRLALDYSSTDIWGKEKLMLKNVDIVGMFKAGKLTLSTKILEFGLKDINFDALAKKGVTFMKPFGKVIGVDDSDYDWSRREDPDEDEDMGEEDAD